jgi:hypothetical protein
MEHQHTANCALNIFYVTNGKNGKEEIFHINDNPV